MRWIVAGALFFCGLAHAEMNHALLTLRPTAPRLRFDLDSVFERALGAARVGLTDGKVKFLRVRNGQREDVAAPIGRGARVMPVVDLSFHTASFLTRFVF
jgi:hypothetical protein